MAGPPSGRPPHITVNSGSGGDLLHGSDISPSQSTPGLSRTLLSPSNTMSARPRPGLGNLNPFANSNSVYSTPHESSDMLLQPPKSGPIRQYIDSPTTGTSRASSAVSSRRSSWDSVAEGGHLRGPFASPFDDSRAPSRAGSIDDEGVNTQTVSEKYNITPSAGLLLYPEDVEKDDWLHNPDPNDPDKIRCDIWNKRALVNLGGLGFLTIGLLFVFVGYPVLTFVRSSLGLDGPTCATDPSCLSDSVPLLKNQRVGLIDPDTPDSVKTKTSHDGTKLNLVFSDEFNRDGRTFYDGDDPYFQGVDIWYGATQDLEWYDPDALVTANGSLNIRFDAFQSHNLNYRSGMLQSWNKMCFKGGRMEASISLPGRGDVEGFWPGFWAMGNLGRPGYTSTTDGLWPYSYHDKCDLGITKNQSAPDGLSLLPGMRLPACTCSGEDHPSPGNSRSAPEIDALEASVGFMGAGFNGATGTASQSLQIAPFDIWYQPDYDYLEIYDNEITGMNVYRGGVYQEAISGVTWLNNDWYEAKGGFQVYGFEYVLGDQGGISWVVGDDYTFSMEAQSIRANGNVGQRVIPEEPMSVVVNFGMSMSFAQVFLADLAATMPATMRVDYIRIYQDPESESVTCDPPGYPTTAYIADHPKAYLNPNMTLWYVSLPKHMCSH